MKTILTTCLTILAFTFLTAQQNFWTDVTTDQIFLPEGAEWEALPVSYRALSLDYSAIKNHLADAPMELTQEARLNPLQITLPMPDGSMKAFWVYEAPVMPASLAAQFPGIKTYAGWGVDNPREKVRFDYGGLGFHALIRTGKDVVYVEPYATNQTQYYMSFYQEDFLVDDNLLPSVMWAFENNETGQVNEGTEPKKIEKEPFAGPDFAPVTLRKYRFALSCTGEYGQSHGGTIASVMATFNTTLNIINGILQPEVAVQLELVPQTATIIFLDPNADPFINANVGTGLLGQNQDLLNMNIGVANYELGHCFTNGCTDVGGVAGGSACGQGKGRGVTCHFSSSVSFIVEQVMSHELGHQFAMSHTFSNCPGNEGQYASNTAYEPGSGSTIMSYSGSCGAENIAFSSDRYYHVASLQQLIGFTRTGGGSTCPELIMTDNNEPELDWPYEDGFYIPISTPFELSATAIDPDGDDVTYCWEQYNLGPISNVGNPIGDAPAFRSWPPVSSNTRIFPRLPTLLSNGSENIEVLPTYTRNLNFRCTVRDNDPFAGGTIWEEVAFHSTDLAGPFLVNYPTASGLSFEAGKNLEVTWDVANTTNNKVNCQHVNIFLSLDGGFTYPHQLAFTTPNDGSEVVYIPEVTSNQARIKVKAANNIFFDISNQNFAITEATEPGYLLDVSTEFQQVCVPDVAMVEINTNAILGFDSLINIEIIGGSILTTAATIDFSATSLTPGESSLISFDFNQVIQDGVFDVVIQATAPGADTIEKTMTFSLVNTDFTALAMLGPENGASGVGFLPDFTWIALQHVDEYDIQISSSPTFAPEFIIDEAYGLTEATYTPDDVALAENTLYFWRIRPNNECGPDEYLSPFAFHTFTVNCSSFPSTDVPKNISVFGLPVITSEITVAQSGEITDLNIKNIQGEHDAIADLEMKLTSPEGKTITLFSGPECFVLPFQFGMDDEAPFELFCPPVNNANFKPVEPLAEFIGDNTIGTWKLEVRVINELGNGGFLGNWGLEFCAGFQPLAPYIVNNEVLQLAPLESRRLRRELLLVDDDDNSASELIYTLIEGPTHGLITRWGNQIGVGETFKQSEINHTDFSNELLRYENTNGDAETDFFKFTVQDGTGGWVGITQFNIEITDDAPPVSTGTSEADLANQINLYPNPAAEQLTVSFDQPIDEKMTINVTDVHGRLLLQQERHSVQQKLQLNTTDLSNGVYFINLQLAETVVTKKFTIQK